MGRSHSHARPAAKGEPRRRKRGPHGSRSRTWNGQPTTLNMQEQVFDVPSLAEAETPEENR